MERSYDGLVVMLNEAGLAINALQNRISMCESQVNELSQLNAELVEVNNQLREALEKKSLEIEELLFPPDIRPAEDREPCLEDAEMVEA